MNHTSSTGATIELVSTSEQSAVACTPLPPFLRDEQADDNQRRSLTAEHGGDPDAA